MSPYLIFYWETKEWTVPIEFCKHTSTDMGDVYLDHVETVK